jgi:hypothetical protein
MLPSLAAYPVAVCVDTAVVVVTRRAVETISPGAFLAKLLDAPVLHTRSSSSSQRGVYSHHLYFLIFLLFVKRGRGFNN